MKRGRWVGTYTKIYIDVISRWSRDEDLVVHMSSPNSVSQIHDISKGIWRLRAEQLWNNNHFHWESQQQKLTGLMRAHPHTNVIWLEIGRWLAIPIFEYSTWLVAVRPRVFFGPIPGWYQHNGLCAFTKYSSQKFISIPSGQQKKQKLHPMIGEKLDSHH